MAEAFNMAFIDKISELKQNIPSGEDQLIHHKKTIKSSLDFDNDNYFNFKQISLTTIYDTIKSLKSTYTFFVRYVRFKNYN